MPFLEHSLLFKPLCPRNDHILKSMSLSVWSSRFLIGSVLPSPQKSQSASWNVTHLPRFVLNASDSMDPPLMYFWQWFLYSIDHELFVYNDDSLPCTYLSMWCTQVLNKCVRQKEKGKMEEKKTGEAGRRNRTCLLPYKYQFWKAKQRITQQDKWMTIDALKT